MEKKQLTPEQVYNRNKTKAKVCRILSPIVFWGGIVLGIVFLIFALKHSFGNIAEIMRLLDDKTLTGEELGANYEYLLAKYGEWVIGSGEKGFTITFVNIGRAMFSGLMIADLIFALVFFAVAFIGGKWVLPKLAQQITNDNQDMVNLTVLKNSQN